MTYDANGGTGSIPIDARVYLAGSTVTILDNTGNLEKAGFAFAGWNTTADGTGTNCAAGATFVMGSANAILYAVWSQNPAYTVTYDANGATGGNVPTDGNSYQQSTTVTVLGNTGTLVKTDYVFAGGWNDKADGTGNVYIPGAAFAMGTANVTLYAVWGPTYKVTYNANGAAGSVPSDGSRYPRGGTLTLLGNTGGLVNAGNHFEGWNTMADLSGTSYAAGATLTMAAADVTLYPVWIPDTFTSGSYGSDIYIDGSTAAPTGPVTIPAGVTYISWMAYMFCTGLTDVTFPPSLTSIGGQAFQGCTGLTSVTIPSRVTDIYDSVFSGCSSLINVTVEATIPPQMSSGSQSFANCATGLVIHVPSVPSVTLAAYKNALGWSDYATQIVSP